MPKAGLHSLEVLRNAAGRIVRRGGVRWTIKDGIVFDNAVLIDEVVRMVEASKEGWSNPADTLFTPRFSPER